MNERTEKPALAIVVPCFNEERVLPETITQLRELLERLIEGGKVSEKSYILFVDDGSEDATWSIVSKHAKISANIRGVKLSKNTGHQRALMAGMSKVFDECDCMISLDADLQDDIFAMETMIEKYLEGYEVVYGVRSSRLNDSFFKKFSAESYYKVMRLMGVDLVYNHADYRLLSKKALGYFLEFRERNLFIRGIVRYIGLRNTVILYERKERFAGVSKYPLKKMLAFAWEGITSLSTAPLKLITIVGFFIFMSSMGMVVWVLGVKLFTQQAMPGWASTVIPIYFIGGVQLLAIGIIGEYLGKIYMEVKQRPHYFIEEELDEKK